MKDIFLDPIKLLPNCKILGLSLIGSRVYGTFNDESDYDFISITDMKPDLIFGDKVNIINYNMESFQKALNEQSVIAYEACCSPNKYIWPNIKTKVTKNILKSAEERSNSDWKKAINTDDTKKAFHSIRVLMFAEQLYKLGKITDFSAANIFYDNIVYDLEEIRQHILQSHPYKSG